MACSSASTLVVIAGVWHRIDDHCGMGVPETRLINPFSKTDWERKGVEPEVKAKAADALQTAERLAANKLQKYQAVGKFRHAVALK